MTVEEIQHLVEQNQHRTARFFDDAADRLGSRRCGSGLRAERGHAFVAGELTRDIDPRVLARSVG